MTTACIIFLCFSLLLYLSATLLFLVQFLLYNQTGLHRWGRRALVGGAAVNGLGLGLHFLFSRLSPLANMLPLISLLVALFVGIGLVAERWRRVPHVGLAVAPIAFLSLLYPLLMPVRFEDAQSVLVQYPWLGVHVLFTLMGYVGFALAFCAALVYLVQMRMLKRGQLNRYLPALDTAVSATFYTAGVGFVFFTIGLVMGAIWLSDTPGEFLGRRDPKIWMALPTWLIFAMYLYWRGIRRQHGSRLKWLVVAGFLSAAANLLGVRHQFIDAPSDSLGESAPTVEQVDPSWLDGPG